MEIYGCFFFIKVCTLFLLIWCTTSNKNATDARRTHTQNEHKLYELHRQLKVYKWTYRFHPPPLFRCRKMHCNLFHSICFHSLYFVMLWIDILVSPLPIPIECCGRWWIWNAAENRNPTFILNERNGMKWLDSPLILDFIGSSPVCGCSSSSVTNESNYLR